MEQITNRKPDTYTKTSKATVQTYKHKDGTITVTVGKSGGKGKGQPGGRYGGKTTVGR